MNVESLAFSLRPLAPATAPYEVLRIGHAPWTGRGSSCPPVGCMLCRFLAAAAQCVILPSRGFEDTERMICLCCPCCGRVGLDICESASRWLRQGHSLSNMRVFLRCQKVGVDPQRIVVLRVVCVCTLSLHSPSRVGLL